MRLENTFDRGDHPRRAIPALGSVMIDHRLLDRAQTLRRRQTFDRDDMRSVKLIHRLKAARNRAITQAAAGRASDQNGARAAVPFATSNLGADEPPLFAQKLNERPEHSVALNDDPLPVQVDENVIRHFELA